MRVYNVRDLVGSSASGGEGGGVPTIAPGVQMGVDPSMASYSDTGKLETVIASTVEPETWVANGGSAGSMQEFHGLITVTATVAVQDKIADLLENLRKADKEGMKK